MPEGSAIQFEELKDELFLGGVYVRLFLANPHFPLRQPNRFLEALLQSYTDQLQVGSPPILNLPHILLPTICARFHADGPHFCCLPSCKA